MIATHRKGSRWRRDVQDWLDARGWETRFRSVGEAGDDITAVQGVTRLSIECKNHKTITLAAFVDQCRGNAPAGEIPVVFIKRKGRASVDDCYVVMDAATFDRIVGE